MFHNVMVFTSQAVYGILAIEMTGERILLKGKELQESHQLYAKERLPLEKVVAENGDQEEPQRESRRHNL